jgi:isopenicillin N synthase-like dioxygenase
MKSLILPEISIDDIQVVSKVKTACENFGFFYLKCDNIELLETTFSESKKFFNLSYEEKYSCLCNKGNLGYTSFQDETLAPHIQSCGDTKEGYYIGRDPDCDEEMQYQNVWPPEHLGLSEWEHVMKQYHLECCHLGLKVVRIISEALELPPHYFDHYFEKPTALLRLIKYGKLLSNPNNGVFGAGEHTDYGMITLLATNDVSGLQIFLNNTWIDVPPRPDCYIVNLGDCLQILTNNRFKSTLHRVLITDTEKDRYSMAFFFEPNRSVLIEPLPDFSFNVSCESKYPNTFVPMTYGEYLSKKYEQTHSDYKKLK